MANRTYRILIAAVAVALLAACNSSTSGTAQVGAGAPQTPPATETSTSDTVATDTDSTDTDSTSTDSTRARGGQPALSTPTSTPASSSSTSTPSTSTFVPATSATAPKTTAPPPGSDDTFPDCVYGDWIASNEWFVSAVAQLSGGAAHYISGDVLVTFQPDGTATTHYRKWTNEFVVEDVKITVVRDGKDAANYTVEDDGSFAMQDVTLSSKLTMTGHSPQGTVVMGNPDPEPTSATGTFLCIDKLLYVQTGDGEMVLGRPALVNG